MKNTLKMVAVTALAGAATLGAGSAAAWWGHDYYDDYYGPWGGGPWYGYPGYGYGLSRLRLWLSRLRLWLPALRRLGLPALRRLGRLPGLRLGWLSLLRGTRRADCTGCTGYHQHFQVTAGIKTSAPARARFFISAWHGHAPQTNSVISAPCALVR